MATQTATTSKSPMNTSCTPSSSSSSTSSASPSLFDSSSSSSSSSSSTQTDNSSVLHFANPDPSVLDFVTAVQISDAREVKKMDQTKQFFTEIIPKLYLTSANHITEDNLVAYSVTHVVNATRTVPLKRSVRSMRVNVLDSAYEKICDHFDAVADFIQDALRGNGCVAVHCISGISRSSTLVIAFLMKHRHMTLKEAFALVRSKRWFIRPNTGFFKQLVDYELQLFGTNTVKMVWSDAAETQVPDFILEDASNYKYFYLCIKK